MDIIDTLMDIGVLPDTDMAIIMDTGMAIMQVPGQDIMQAGELLHPIMFIATGQMELPEPVEQTIIPKQEVEHLLPATGLQTNELLNRQTGQIMYIPTGVGMFIKRMVIIGKAGKVVNGRMPQNQQDLDLRPEKQDRQPLLLVTKARHNQEM